MIVVFYIMFSPEDATLVVNRLGTKTNTKYNIIQKQYVKAFFLNIVHKAPILAHSLHLLKIYIYFILGTDIYTIQPTEPLCMKKVQNIPE